MIYFLDDDPVRTKKFRSSCPSAYTFETAADIIEALDENRNDVKQLFLDHDLSGEMYVSSSREDCGMEVVRWLCSQPPFDIQQIIVHSCNKPAAKEMVKKLKDHGYEAAWVAWPRLAQILG